MGWLLVYPLLAIGLFLRYGFRAIGMKGIEYLRALTPAIGSTLAMAAAVLVARMTLPAGWPALARLLCQVLIGAVVYGALVCTVQRERLRTVIGLLKGRGEPINHTGESSQERPAIAPADRLLVISYHFPPDPAVGSMRWRKLARYAAERGWSLDVIAQDPPTLARRDDTALADLPPGIRVYGVAPNPSRLERAMNALWLRWKRFTGGRRREAAPVGPAAAAARRESRPRSEIRWMPRAPRDLARAYFAAMEYAGYRRWARDAARLALRIYDPQRHRAVITCGPPHPAHLAGVTVARRTKLPLVLDLRDPWSLVQRLPEAIASPVWLSLARRGERRAVDHAALVIANTHAARNAMRQAYPEATGRIIAVPNGFDDDPVPTSPSTRRFTIAYAGSVYLDRDPRELLRGAARMIRELGLTPNEIGIEFMGEVHSFDGIPLEAIAREEGIAECVRTYPSGPRAQALDFLARGSVLVVLPQDSDMAIPAKVFEYMRFDAWMLVFAARGSATDLLLEGTAADVVRPGDPDAVSEILRKRYLQHLRGERGIRLSTNDGLSRRKQASVLFEALEGIIGEAPAPHVPEEGRARGGNGVGSGVIPAWPSAPTASATTA
jgi:glycosyltransferase involved in cell wall biosynthesis